MSRNSAQPFRVRLDSVLLKRSLILFPALIAIYYVVGMLWYHKIDDNPAFTVEPGTRLQDDSYAVGLAIALLDREVNKNGWVANAPFYVPAALLHNMASFQSGIVETITSFADVLDAALKTQGTSSVDLEVTVDKLSKRPDIWSWDWSEPWGYLGNSEREYREGLLDLQGYNVAVADHAAVFPRDAAALALILTRLSGKLQEAAADLDREAQYRPLILSRRLGDAFYRTRGIAYCELILLRGLKADFTTTIGERGLTEEIERAEAALRRVALFSPLFVFNGAPDSVVIPSHPLIASYYALDAQRALQHVVAKLGS
jgi:hypothetical protein